MLKRTFHLLITAALMLTVNTVLAQDEEECDLEEDKRHYADHFSTEDCRFLNRQYHFAKENPYFIMEPGWQVVLEGEDEDEFIRVEVTVTNETRMVAGVNTRIIEEVEFIDGELYEISRNFFAICAHTNDIYYFGEEVDFYEDGEIIGHEGAWLVGEDGATPGILIPGTVLVGSRYMQEVSPGNAEDRAEIAEVTDVELDGVVYEDALILLEGSPLSSPCDVEEKVYAKGIGNIVDEELELVEFGFIFKLPPNVPFKQ